MVMTIAKASSSGCRKQLTRRLREKTALEVAVAAPLVLMPRAKRHACTERSKAERSRWPAAVPSQAPEVGIQSRVDSSDARETETKVKPTVRPEPTVSQLEERIDNMQDQIQELKSKLESVSSSNRTCNGSSSGSEDQWQKWAPDTWQQTSGAASSQRGPWDRDAQGRMLQPGVYRVWQ